jgi:hypothetical protein
MFLARISAAVSEGGGEDFVGFFEGEEGGGWDSILKGFELQFKHFNFSGFPLRTVPRKKSDQFIF